MVPVVEASSTYTWHRAGVVGQVAAESNASDRPSATAKWSRRDHRGLRPAGPGSGIGAATRPGGRRVRSGSVARQACAFAASARSRSNFSSAAIATRLTAASTGMPARLSTRS